MDAKALMQYQDHWLDRLVLPTLATGFHVAVLVLAQAFLRFFSPTLSLPSWLVLAGSVVTLEGVYITQLFVTVRTPVTFRVIEVGGLIAGVYGLLYLDHPSVLPVLKAPNTWVPMLVVLFAWILGVSAGARFAAMGNITDMLGDRDAATLTWEQESLRWSHRVDTARRSALVFFTRRLLSYAFLTVAATAVATESYPDRVAALGPWPVSVWVGTAVLMACGLALQACVYLYRLRTIWRETGVSVGADLPGRWLSSAFVFIGIVIGAGVLLPANISPLRFSQVVGFIDSLLAGIGGGAAPARLPDTGSNQVNGPAGPMSGPGEMNGLAALLAVLPFILLAVGVAALLLAALGYLIRTFAGREWERLQGIARFPVLVFLWFQATGRQFMVALRSLFVWGKRSMSALGHRLRPAGLGPVRHSPGTPGTQPPPSEAALYVRHVFSLLIGQAKRHGLGPSPAETPAEYGRRLGKSLYEGDEAVQALTEAYVQARYSNHRLTNVIKPVVEQAFGKVVASLRAKYSRDEREAEDRAGEESSPR